MGEPASGSRTVIRGGLIVDGSSPAPRRADLAMRDGRIIRTGEVGPEAGDTVLDAGGRYLMPGFIDTHSHADGAVFREDVQYALLRQGVTTVIAGQDGVSYAPGDGAYAGEYFAALNGAHPAYGKAGAQGVDALLRSYDGTTPLNVGYLVPAGTVRHQVCGYASGPAGPAEVEAMTRLIAQGLRDGALGLSSGLDYLPGIHQDTAELTAICRPVAEAGALYVTHMRGGYEANSRIGTDEVTAIAAATGVSVHISHYHGPSGLLLELVDAMAADGVDASFDAYPYRRGCSLLAMPVMPPDMLAGTRVEVLAALADGGQRARLLDEWFPALERNPLAGPEWADNLTLAHIGGGSHEWAHGLTVAQAAASAGSTAAEFVVDILLASELDTSVVMKVRNQRPYDDLARLFAHPAHTAGSDGIYIGRHPHPRAWGTFARFLRLFTRERGNYSWTDAAWHLSGKAAERFCLPERGRLRPGHAADVAIVDPERVTDRATYADPTAAAVGIDDVFVAGRPVLAGGELTGLMAGRGLRRNGPVR